MYRGVALAARAAGRPPAVERPGARIELGERVLLDGGDVTDAIRAPEVSGRASRVAADPAVRTALVVQQRGLLGAATGSPRGATSARSSRRRPR